MTDLLRVYSDDEIGKDGYPFAWHETVKHLVREQAGHRCVRCGHPYRQGEHGRGEWSPCDERCAHTGPIQMQSEFGDWGDPPWYDPDVTDPEHAPHIAGEIAADGYNVLAKWRILTVHHFDGIKTNLRWWNLMAACQRCHLEIQGKVRLDRPYPWEHSEWFRPFAAGFYASHILHEELTREQTEERLNELLEVGANHAAVERMVL